jgi:hypothetical protein
MQWLMPWIGWVGLIVKQNSSEGLDPYLKADP